MLQLNNTCELTISADDFQEAIKITKPSLHQTDIDRYTQM